MKKYLHILTFIILLASPVWAEEKGEKHEHNHGHHGDDHHATIHVPHDLAGVWAHLNAYSKVVTDAVSEGNLEVVHKQQANLEALVAALSESLEDLDSAKQKRVEGMIANTRRALGQLHEATDKENTASAQRAAKSLTGVLALLKVQYPKEVTGGVAEVEDDIGPHEGMLADFQSTGGETTGRLELKLHDDKGDLELWLFQDKSLNQTFDLPADSEITVSFEDAEKDTATLAVRNMNENEDESGTPTMRNGKTNYFIFPGDSGADASWLKGKDFKSKVTVSFGSPEGEYQSEDFLLIPHTHHDH